MRNVIVVFLLLTSAVHCYGKKIKGSITTNGVSKEILFNIKVNFLSGEPNFERLQYRVRYYDENGKKRTLRADDADEISFEYGGRKFRMISCANTVSMFTSRERIFLKLEIDGPLRLYRFYYKRTTSTNNFGAGGGAPGSFTYIEDDLIFQKKNGPLKQPKSLGWRKDMLAYFSDCPELASKIGSRDLRRKEIEAIVLYYNQHCAD